MFDASTGSAPAVQPDWSLAGLHLAVYRLRGVLAGIPLSVGHAVAALRAEDADCPRGGAACGDTASVPPGTAVRYDMSANGCGEWVTAAPFENVAVPPGDRVCYRLTLTTRDPTETPVVGVTNLYELAQRRTSANLASLLCLTRVCAAATPTPTTG
jgi:hypothetical protein